MTTQEQRTIEGLNKIISELREENRKFREDVTNQVNALAKNVEQKHMPYNLEMEVVKAVQGSIAKALSESMTGYNSPLTKFAQNVVVKYQNNIEAIFDKIVQEGIATDEFKERVREVLLHKIAKTMTSGIDGSIDKTINLMKQDSVFRSRLTLAVNGLVNEFLNQK